MSAVKRAAALCVASLAAAFVIAAPAHAASHPSSGCGSKVEDYSGNFTGILHEKGKADRHITVRFLDGNAEQAYTYDTKTHKTASLGGNYLVADIDGSAGVAVPLWDGLFAGEPRCSDDGEVVAIHGGVSYDGKFKNATPLTLMKRR
ncbi:hypothetical protein DWB77_00260 [Streptomyces hundungensis]|uniref:Uncharacterized protein n=1 Tax=Streptomyces hundungensis TaxID=1077946 RepID=A0A387H7M1_9ACTN|nr:hypothetical protein [Streptomyces hundungensis]AYG78153.1 hypothetical protein DWB77_00260 [Streptomyces hundungensis]